MKEKKSATSNILKAGLLSFTGEHQTGEEQVITITRPFEFVSNMSIFSEDRYQYSVSSLRWKIQSCAW